MSEFTRTYALIEGDGSQQVQGKVDGMEALAQAVRLMLQVERGAYEIFSEEYGLQVSDLLGMDYPYVAAELERRIKECLLADERIEAVEDMVLSRSGNRVSAEFVIRSIYGEDRANAEVVM